MGKAVKKHAGLLAALVMISAVCILFAGRKEGMFIDEIYSFGLSNSYYAPFVKDLKDGDLTDKIMTRQELVDYLSVGTEDRFAFGSVYYNQVNDVHPPLYYWLLHLACSLAPEGFRMTPGLVLDYLLYLLTLLALYALVLRLMDSRAAAVGAVLLYGLSVIGLSTMLMIRMYVLLTLLTVLLAYSVAGVLRYDRRRDKVLCGLFLFLGFLTQYYFVFYAFFLCGFAVLCLLWRREWRRAGCFALWAFGGVGLFVLSFPACIDHLFADALVSGGNALENARNLGQYPERILFFAKEAGHRMKGIVYVSLVLGALCLLRVRRLWAAYKKGGLKLDTLLILLPALITFPLVAVISPVTEIRYVYNIIPILVLADALMLLWLLEVDAEMLPLALKWAAVLLIGCFALWQARCLPPDYLYDEYSDYDAMLQQYQDAPCIYLDKNYSEPITYDMLQLMNFEEFYITENPASAQLLDYIGEAERFVVFIDISKFWSSGFDSQTVLEELLESTGFETTKPLYSNGFSDVYLMEESGL